ncbi:MAG: RHS repeat-associated core domain-containing protein [Mariniphaga sp.]|nr:RHS repeat-associated core domain-containing protein [Mariniphaga sp.]
MLALHGRKDCQINFEMEAINPYAPFPRVGEGPGKGAEGRLKWDDHDSLFYPEYFIKDHLGNVRVVLTTNPNFTNPTIQVTDYYPFGLEFQDVSISDNRNLYNSKELQTDAKLWWYDYGARFYDPGIGRWHAVDPLAESSRRWSPYTYCINNPIRFIDPDGREMTDFFDKDGKLVQRIKDGSNAVFQQTGSGTNLHYEFTGEYSEQGGVDKVTDEAVTSVTQEQQNLNDNNPSLDQDYNPETQKYGGTHCNQATQNVQLATQSAKRAQGDESINLFTPGRANDIAQNLADNKYPAYTSATQAEAEKAAGDGTLAIAAYKNPSGSGHVATLSVGTNIQKGTLANIGVKGSTGFVPLKGAKNAAFRNEHDVKYYILK